MSGFYHIARDIAFGGSRSSGVGDDDDVEDVIKKEEDERNAKNTVATRRQQQQESSSVRRTHDEPKERIPEVSRRKPHQEEVIVDKQQSELDLAAQKAEKIRAARQRYLERRASSTKK